MCEPNEEHIDFKDIRLYIDCFQAESNSLNFHCYLLSTPYSGRLVERESMPLSLYAVYGWYVRWKEPRSPASLPAKHLDEHG